VNLGAVAGIAQELRVYPGVGSTGREWLDVIKACPSISLGWLECAWGGWINGCLLAQAAVAAIRFPDGVGG